MRTRITVDLEMQVEADAVALERAAVNEGRRAARALYRKALVEADSRAVEASGGVRQRVEQRWFATLMGRLRVGRYRVASDRRTHHPLDDLLQLQTGEASPGVRSLVRRLGRRLPAQEIAEVVTEVTGTDFSRYAVLRVLHQADR